jgi:TatA/E family protein of Tat protein translocase
MFGLGAGEILLISAIAILFIGPQKLPEIAKQMGKAIRAFKSAKDDFLADTDQIENKNKVE